MTTFYLATCVDCSPVLPVPFFDEAERDHWVEQHEGATGHEVRIANEVRP